MRGREERVPPNCPFPAVAGKQGREGEGEGRGRWEEAEAGQWKGRALGTKAHLMICSASAGPPLLGCHGTAAGHGSVQRDTD